MARLKAFTATRVALSKTLGDIETLLHKRGINASQWTHFAPMGQTPGEVTLVFEWARDKGKPPVAYRVRVEYLPKPGPRGGPPAPSREQAKETALVYLAHPVLRHVGRNGAERGCR